MKVATAPVEQLEHSSSGMLRLFSGLEGLVEVERLVKARSRSESSTLQAIPFYLLELGGKRVRPLLAILSAKIFGMQLPDMRLIEIAAGIEMIHMATLLHDDIIDGAVTRRHRDAPLVRFGQNATILAGDFLFVRAFGLCAKLDRFIIESTERACVDLTEGEMLEMEPGTVRNLERCLEVSRKKTASLFALGALCGSHIAGAPIESVERMRECGELLGIAFQIVDDMLDVTSSQDILGKPSGADLRELKPSVVNALWLRKGSALSKELFSGQIRDPLRFEAALKKAKVEITESAVLDDARSFVASYVARARATLREAISHAPVVDRKAVGMIEELIAFAVERAS